MTKRLLLTKILCFIFCGCSFPYFSNTPYEEITVTLPEWQLEEIQVCKWKIEIQSESFSEKINLEPDEKEIHFLISRNKPLSITASPITCFSNTDGKSKFVFFKPAGNIYPYNIHNGKIQLTWQEGFSAYIMQQLFKSNGNLSRISRFIHSFNWQKLTEQIETYTTEAFISKNYFYNPWLCDIQKLMDNFCIGSFSANLINNKKVLNVDLNSILEKDCHKKIYSSYMPENQIIKEKNIATIDLLNANYFVTENQYLIIKQEASKKISSQFIFLPILIDDI